MSRKEIRMSDALPLPTRPNLEQYKKLAKDFQLACKSSDPDALRAWATRWLERLARLRGVELTAELRRRINYDAERIANRWAKFQRTNERARRCTLADAQFFLARAHGFSGWPQ